MSAVLHFTFFRILKISHVSQPNMSHFSHVRQLVFPTCENISHVSQPNMSHFSHVRQLVFPTCENMSHVSQPNMSYFSHVKHVKFSHAKKCHMFRSQTCYISFMSNIPHFSHFAAELRQLKF